MFPQLLLQHFWRSALLDITFWLLDLDQLADALIDPRPQRFLGNQTGFGEIRAVGDDAVGFFGIDAGKLLLGKFAQPALQSAAADDIDQHRMELVYADPISMPANLGFYSEIQVLGELLGHVPPSFGKDPTIRAKRIDLLARIVKICAIHLAGGVCTSPEYRCYPGKELPDLPLPSKWRCCWPRELAGASTALEVSLSVRFIWPYQLGRGGLLLGTKACCCAHPLNSGSNSGGNDSTKSTSIG